MNNKVTDTKTKIMSVLKDFKEKMDLHKDKITKRHLEVLKNSVEKREELVNDKDDDDLEYLNDNVDDIKRLFQSFLTRHDINYTPETAITNDLHSTFIETPEWIKLERPVLNPHNNDNKCFQYSITLSLYHEQIG